MAPQFETVSSEYASLWKSMAVRPEKRRQVETTANRIIKERDRYETVSAATGVPWFVIGLIHAMESGLSFHDHLHNGDPLEERTVHVPRGRPKNGQPPFTWEESAIDALGYDGLSHIKDWCVERIAYMLESYNGWGYRSKGIHSPYLWSMTNHYTKGKYVQDGVYDPNAVSGQSGAMAILSVMREMDPSIVLTFCDGEEAVQEPDTEDASEGSTTGKPGTTVPGDLISVVSGIGIATTLVTHNTTAGTAPASETPSAVSSPSAGEQAPEHPPATAGETLPAQTKAAPQQPEGTTTGTVQPAHQFITYVNDHYTILLGGLGVLFVLGLILSWRARSARKRSAAQQFLSAVPQLISRAASGRDLASAPLVRSVRARLLTVAWIAATIAVNAIVTAKLLQYFHLASAKWYPPFSTLGGLYDSYAQEGFRILADAASAQFGIGLSQWPWLMPLFVFYVATASAFLVANLGLMKRDTSAEKLWGTVVHAGWLLAIPAFILDAIRYRVVSRFARQNTVLFFAYIAAFIGAYAVARFINDDFLAAYAGSLG